MLETEICSCNGVLAPIHQLSHNKRTRRDVYEHLQMNAPFIYVRRPYAQRGAALLRASAMRAAKKKRRVRRAGGASGGPGAGPAGRGLPPHPPPPTPPPPPPPPVTGRLRNPRSSRTVHPEPVRFSKKKKKHPFAKIIEKTPFHYTDIQWPHDQRDPAGGKT